MSEQTDSFKDSLDLVTLARDRLLPYNRRIRHLKGITIRSLTVTPAPSQTRGKTIDDDALPSTLRSAAKARIQRESLELQHSRSSTDLRNGGIDKGFSFGISGKGKQPATGSRPTSSRLRRRSTMEWVDRTPLERHKKLENVNRERLADMFFTLHVPDEQEPIYISETVSKAMNANFQFFDLDACGPGITRLDQLSVKVWAKTDTMDEFQYTIDWTVQLKQLTYLGKTLESLHHPLPPNSIVFHLLDGLYTSFVGVPSEFVYDIHPILPLERAQLQTSPTSTYDQLMQLATLDACIQDALATRNKIKEDIENVLRDNMTASWIINCVPECQDRLKSYEAAVVAAEREVLQSQKRKKQLHSLIRDRAASVEEGRRTISRGTGDMHGGLSKLAKDHKRIEALGEVIIGQRRRICEDLLQIFPIEPIPGRQLAFTIRGLYLPNSEFSNCNEEEVAAALGYVVQIIQRLQMYLTRLVPYPVTPQGSTSTIEDPISMTNGPRTYPLFVKATVRYRFEYGVFLLNKDIEILANLLGLRLLDIRQTLPNLKYVLYVATAGKGDLPARKMGGIRGLYGHVTGSNRDSEVTDDSNASQDTRNTSNQVTVSKANGNTNIAYRSKKSPATATSRLRELV